MVPRGPQDSDHECAYVIWICVSHGGGVILVPGTQVIEEEDP